MRDAGGGVLSPEQLTNLTLSIDETQKHHGHWLHTLDERLLGIDKRLDDLAAGQQHLLAGQHEIVRKARLRDEKLGEFRAEMRQRLSLVEHRLDGLDKRFTEVDRRFDAVDERFESVDRRFDQMQAEMSGKFDGVQRQLAAIAEAVGVGRDN